MSSSGNYRQTVLFSAYLTEGEDEMEFAELDMLSAELVDELNKVEPYRNVDFRLDYLGIAGDAEFIFIFRRSWDDRESDLMDYLDKIQQTIEDNLPVIISERETISIIPI